MDTLILKETFNGPTGVGYPKIDTLKMIAGDITISTFINNGRHADGRKKSCGFKMTKINRDKLIKFLLAHQKEYPV